MANAKISALPAVTTPASTDEIAVNQGGTTKKETRAQLHTLESGETINTTAGALTAAAITGTTATISNDQDAATEVFLKNTDGGTAATAELYVTNDGADTGGLALITGGGGFSPVGGFFQDAGTLVAGTALSGGLAIMTRDTAAIRFYTDGHTNLRASITSAGDLSILKRFLEATITTLADDATPTVAAGNLFKTGGTTTITDFDDGVVGQTIQILAAHSVTITDGAPILLAGGNYGMTDSDTLTLTMFNDQVWVEVARSVN